VIEAHTLQECLIGDEVDDKQTANIFTAVAEILGCSVENVRVANPHNDSLAEALFVPFAKVVKQVKVDDVTLDHRVHAHLNYVCSLVGDGVFYHVDNRRDFTHVGQSLKSLAEL